jgi:hypothetical protein
LIAPRIPADPEEANRASTPSGAARAFNHASCAASGVTFWQHHGKARIPATLRPECETINRA